MERIKISRPLSSDSKSTAADCCSSKFFPQVTHSWCAVQAYIGESIRRFDCRCNCEATRKRTAAEVDDDRMLDFAASQVLSECFYEFLDVALLKIVGI